MYVVARASFYTLISIVLTANAEIRSCVKWSFTRGEKTRRKLLNHQPRNVVAVAREMVVDKRFPLKNFNWETFGVLYRW